MNDIFFIHFGVPLCIRIGIFVAFMITVQFNHVTSLHRFRSRPCIYHANKYVGGSRFEIQINVESKKSSDMIQSNSPKSSNNTKTKKIVKKTVRTGLEVYREIKPVGFADSFNSTTIRLLLSVSVCFN